MADVNKTVDILTGLQFSSFDQEWVQEVWDRDFTDFDPLPINVDEEIQENNYYANKLADARKVLLPWAKGEEGKSGEGFWTVLVENDLSHKHFIAFLFYIMETGSKRVATAVQKQAGISAAEVYFNVVSIPGSGAFKIFHPMLFQKALNFLKSLNQLGTNPAKRKRKQSPARSSQGQRKGKSRRKRTQEDEPDRDEDEDIEEDEGEEDGLLTHQEICSIKRHLLGLLKGFISFLKVFSLSQSESSSQHALQVLAELTKVEPDSMENNFNMDININSCESVPQLAYMGLSLLCTSHGDSATMTVGAFKYLLSSILMLIGESKAAAAQTIPRDIQLVKDHAVAYVCHVIKTGGPDVLPSVRVLLQHMCAKVPDKAEYRSKVAQTVVTLLKELPGVAYARMIQWIYKYSRNVKIGYRVFALDIIGMLLNEPERQLDADLPEEYAPFVSHCFLIQLMLSRCSDVASTVRARAISGFAQCVSSKDSVVALAVKEIMTPVAIGRPPISRLVPTPTTVRTASNTVQEENQTEDGSTKAVPVDVGKTPALHVAFGGTPGVVTVTPGVEITLSDAKGVLSMLRRRAGDEKTNVRKAALIALEQIIRMEGANFNKQDLDILHDRCQDPALSVRKQALLSLTDLLMEMPENKQIQSSWLDGVLPMVMDRETGAQEKCIEILKDTLLTNIVPHQRSTGQDHHMVWSMLDILAGTQGVDLRRFLGRAGQHWARHGFLKPSLTSSLQTHIGTENNAGVWMFLAELAPYLPKFNPSFVVDYWEQHVKSAGTSDFETMHRVLCVMSHTAKHISAGDSSDLAADLKHRLQQFNLPPQLIAATVTTLAKLCNSLSEDPETRHKSDQWCEDLLQACDRYLSKVILSENADDPIDEDSIVRHLFTLGEIAQLCPAKTPKRVFMLVQSLIAAPVISSIDGSSQAFPLSQQLSQFSQCSQDMLSQFKGSKMSNTIRAHAFLTLGKLCLQNEDIAKKCVAAMARELETCTDVAVRNNVVIIMCDLCIRYTNLCDRYVPNIAACLKDESPLIRKQTLTLLTRLLQEDFLKWKGSLFFRFIMALVDEDKDIKEFAEFCLVHLLLQRHPTMFYQHFVECVFHFNSYENHTVYNKFPQSDREKKMFSLKGKSNFSKRMQVYRFLLEHMSDEHRFQLTAKLTQDILGSVVDNVLPLDVDTSALLQDTLAILCCKEIKLSSMRSKPTEEIADELDMAAAVMEKAKKTLISQVLKKNVIENIVPVVISLKHMLEKQRSPVQRDLMLYLRELMKDYKNEVKDIMSADKQLANEIEFDLRKFEEQQAEAERERLQALSSPKTANNACPPDGSSRPASPRTPNASPQGRRASAQGSKSSPSKVVSPKPAPVLALMSPKQLQGTPRRRVSLSTLAIINSARRAMKGDQQAPEVVVNEDVIITPKRGEKSVVEKTPPRSGRKSSESPEKDSFKTPSSKGSDAFKTPDRVGRAISTPEASMLGNLTFAPGNMSMIPPSPIPTSMPIRLYSTNTQQTTVPITPKSNRKKQGDQNQPPDDIVCMFSPDRPTPKPRPWNIKSHQKNENKDKKAPPEKASDGLLSLTKSKRENAKQDVSQTSQVRRQSARNKKK